MLSWGFEGPAQPHPNISRVRLVESDGFGGHGLSPAYRSGVLKFVSATGLRRKRAAQSCHSRTSEQGLTRRNAMCHETRPCPKWVPPLTRRVRHNKGRGSCSIDGCHSEAAAFSMPSPCRLSSISLEILLNFAVTDCLSANMRTFLARPKVRNMSFSGGLSSFMFKACFCLQTEAAFKDARVFLNVRVRSSETTHSAICGDARTFGTKLVRIFALERWLS